jgi:hypothetical protein
MDCWTDLSRWIDRQPLLPPAPPILITQHSTHQTHTHPFQTIGVELIALYVKLLVSPLYKQWAWRSKVKPGLKLNSKLTFRLPFRADLQVHTHTQCND